VNERPAVARFAFVSLLSLICLTVGTTVARAGTPPSGTMDAAWTDCYGSPGAGSDMQLLCTDPTPRKLLCGVTATAPVDSVLAIEVILDLITDSTTLPDWWQYAPGGCRYGQLTTSADFGSLAACADFWQGQTTFGIPPIYEVGVNGQANRARIHASFAVLSNVPRTLAAGIHYYGAALVFQNDPGSCSGCDVSTCLVLNAVQLDRPQTLAGDVVLTTPAVIGANRATWRGTGAPCDAVPARRTTWGQLKSLYR
jgi:hypothetical protein